MGTKSVIRDRLKLAELTTRLVGQPYALGSQQGLDCFSAVVEYLRTRGVEVPADFEGHSTTEYKALFLSDPSEAKRLMVELVSSLLDEILPSFAFAGDILLARTPGSETLSQSFLAIHGGNGCMLAATEEKGIYPLPIRVYEIVRAFRIRRVG